MTWEAALFNMVAMRPLAAGAFVLASLLLTIPVAPIGAGPDPGRELYEAGCAKCHGLDGRGVDATQVAFTAETPDFTDCSFSSREPDGDWIAVAHQGGPVRAFDVTMPAFGEAFTVEQLQHIIDYIRGFCRDPRWPRGELNLPRPFLTEKAFPEDEAVFVTTVNTDGPASVVEEIVYEKRFGPKDQIEITIPFGIASNQFLGGPAAGSDVFLGNIEVGVKRVLLHDLGAGTIVSAGVETGLPTGNRGSNAVTVEPFASVGKILPNNAFLHLQGVVEISTEAGAGAEIIFRGAAGRSVTEGEWGRTWTPMLEWQTALDSDLNNLEFDIVPQVQFTLNTRQHIIGNVGVRVPVTNTPGRPVQLLLYVLWDWFDGGLFDGW